MNKRIKDFKYKELPNIKDEVEAHFDVGIKVKKKGKEKIPLLE